jgi:hypothetical protein
MKSTGRKIRAETLHDNAVTRNTLIPQWLSAVV